MLAQTISSASAISWPNSVRVDDTAIRLLDSDTKPLVVSLTCAVQAALESLQIPFEEIEIYGFDDPEDSRDQIIVTLWVRLPSDEAMSIWTTMSRFVREWRDNLPQPKQYIAFNLIAFEVRWRTDASAA